MMIKSSISWVRVRALLIKETIQIFKDPSTLLISVFLPLLLLFLYGFGVSLDLNHLRVGLVLEDTAPDAQSFVESLTNSRYFDVHLVRDRRELLEDIEKGAIRGFIVVPSYFSAFRGQKSQIAPLQVIADGSEPNTANFVQYYAQGALRTWLTQERIKKNIPENSLAYIASRYWYNEELESRFFLLSGSLAIIMTLIGTLLTALVVSREWERGTMEALLSTPCTKGELLIGKVVPYFVLGLVSMFLCTLVSTWGYGLPFRGSWLLLLCTTCAFLVCALGTGLVISTMARSQIIASQISLFVGFLPAYILSGFLFEISSMPYWIQLLTYVIPAKYFVQSLQTLFLAGNVVDLILYNTLFMLCMGFLLFLITFRKTQKRLE